jgi:hypothetical protein
MRDDMSETKPDPKRTHAPVDPINMTQPFWAVMYQTETRNVWEVFTGPNGLVAAQDHAAATALRTGKLVSVIGPQSAVYGPPPPVLPVAAQVRLAFGTDDDGRVVQ